MIAAERAAWPQEVVCVSWLVACKASATLLPLQPYRLLDSQVWEGGAGEMYVWYESACMHV